MYVIRRYTKDGGGYVAPAGSKNSYTQNVLKARQYPTREVAEAHLCPENEFIEPAYTRDQA